MSRIGRLPIKIPDGVKVNVEADKIKIEGPKGKAEHVLNKDFTYKIENNEIKIAMKESVEITKQLKMMYGMERSILNGKIMGVAEEYTKVLLLKGIGYKAQLQGQVLSFTVGFTHPVIYRLPDNVHATIDDKTKTIKIVLKSCDKNSVGKVAAEIRKIRPPEPYQGKGIMYENERIRRKVGKAAATGAAGAVSSAAK
ncbi:MAG: 50S ribosomal protein L6 [Candidatus Goldbacteria bacterium]|nr:50S ribosomal protein L6 [Candidatus Goldiibacteriota bacterium]